jgi:hypothetical protein
VATTLGEHLFRGNKVKPVLSAEMRGILRPGKSYG